MFARDNEPAATTVPDVGAKILKKPGSVVTKNRVTVRLQPKRGDSVRRRFSLPGKVVRNNRAYHTVFCPTNIDKKAASAPLPDSVVARIETGP